MIETSVIDMETVLSGVCQVIIECFKFAII